VKVGGLLLHLPAGRAAEAVGPRNRRQAARTWDPGPLSATGQWDDVDHARGVLNIVRHSDQDRTLGDAGHEAESFGEMFICCWFTGDCTHRLLVRRLTTKSIKRKDLDQPGVSCVTIFVWRGDD
jgi:hypothetical protein